MAAWRILFVPLLALLVPGMACAKDAPELHDDLIHADIPLFGSGDTKWPAHFTDGDDFGCSSRVAFGDWLYQPSDDDDASWYRITNYGVFHCFAIVRSADERADLAHAPFAYSFFVPLGEATARGKRIELWALQQGARPGSDYLLLAREAGGDDIIKRFDVLQRDCPRENVREGPSLDTLLTRYCAINSKAALRALARRMATRPLLATLIWHSAVPERN